MTNIVESLTINGIAIEGMHGIEPGTAGLGADESTELWRPPGVNSSCKISPRVRNKNWTC